MNISNNLNFINRIPNLVRENVIPKLNSTQKIVLAVAYVFALIALGLTYYFCFSNRKVKHLPENNSNKVEQAVKQENSGPVNNFEKHRERLKLDNETNKGKQAAIPNNPAVMLDIPEDIPLVNGNNANNLREDNPQDSELLPIDTSLEGFADEQLVEQEKTGTENNFEPNEEEHKLQDKANKDEQAAEQGDANAQFMLGECYLYGRSKEKNETTAFSWYKKSCKARTR